MNTIATAHHEYTRRPDDERYPSLTAMVEAARAQQARSVETTRTLDTVSVVQVGEGPTAGIGLQTAKGTVRMGHYALGQYCGLVGAPASYVRSVPPHVILPALEYGHAKRAQAGAQVQILLERPEMGTPIVRAISGKAYSRVWDADLYGALVSHFGDARTPGQDGAWGLPTAWDGQPAGAYRGDRDAFAILVNGGSIVQDPTLRGGTDGAMFRGIMVGNSEVGARSVSVEAVMFRYVCGNLMLWGAILDRRYRRRHVGTDARVLRHTLAEITAIARQWTARPAREDEQLIRGMADRRPAADQDGAVEFLRKMGATEDAATGAIAAATEHETTIDPLSYWGLVQGLTRVSQQAQYTDGRLFLDRIAQQVAARGARVAA